MNASVNNTANSRTKVESRNEAFTEKTSTKIWQEIPDEKNPYNAQAARCHGYDLLDLTRHCQFGEVLFLLFRGNLPQKDEIELFDKLMITLINPGPRHNATRAAMAAGVGKTQGEHILPIATALMGGESDAAAMEASMRFLRKHKKQCPKKVANELLTRIDIPLNDDCHIAPGFGSINGGADTLCERQAVVLGELAGTGPCFEWATAFVANLPEQLSWLRIGLAAAVFTDLGFQPKVCVGLYQLFNAPGMLAHGNELSKKPITAMPFVRDEDYVIQDPAK